MPLFRVVHRLDWQYVTLDYLGSLLWSTALAPRLPSLTTDKTAGPVGSGPTTSGQGLLTTIWGRKHVRPADKGEILLELSLRVEHKA